MVALSFIRVIHLHIGRLVKSENDTLLARMRPLVYIKVLYQLPSDHVMPGSVVQPTRAKLPNEQSLKARLSILSEPPDKPWQTL